MLKAVVMGSFVAAAGALVFAFAGSAWALLTLAVAMAAALSGAVTASFGIWDFLTAESHTIRVGGFYMDPNDYAAAMVVVVAVSVHLALLYPRQRLLLKGTAAFISGLVATAILLTGSRGGLLSLAVVSMMIVLRQPRRWRILAAATVIAILSGPLWPQSLQDRFLAMVSSELDSRDARYARMAALRSSSKSWRKHSRRDRSR